VKTRIISVANVTAPFVNVASVVAMETNGSKDLSEMSVNCVSGPPQ